MFYNNLTRENHAKENKFGEKLMMSIDDLQYENFGFSCEK